MIFVQDDIENVEIISPTVVLPQQVINDSKQDSLTATANGDDSQPQMRDQSSSATGLAGQPAVQQHLPSSGQAAVQHHLSAGQPAVHKIAGQPAVQHHLSAGQPTVQKIRVETGNSQRPVLSSRPAVIPSGIHFERAICCVL